MQAVLKDGMLSRWLSVAEKSTQLESACQPLSTMGSKSFLEKGTGQRISSSTTRISMTLGFFLTLTINL